MYFMCIDLSTRHGQYILNEFLNIFSNHYPIPSIKGGLGFMKNEKKKTNNTSHVLK